MPTNDYIPSDDAGLISMVDNFSTAIDGGEAAFGLAEADNVALVAARNTFNNAVTALAAAKSAQLNATQVKNSSRAELVALVRQLARRVQAHPTISSAQLASAGLTVRDTTPTAVSAPTTAPILWIGTESKLTHRVHFYDENTPNSKAKPAGVFGLELYRKIGGAAPTSVADCEFVSLDTATPEVVEYNGDQAGQMVYYIGRWATRSGLKGPESAVYSATVVG